VVTQRVPVHRPTAVLVGAVTRVQYLQLPLIQSWRRTTVYNTHDVRIGHQHWDRRRYWCWRSDHRGGDHSSEARPINLFPPRCIAQPNRLPRRSVVFLNVLLHPGWRCYLVKSLWVSFDFDVGLASYELFSTCRSRAWGRRNLLGRSFHGSG
jgi:hypothetical protein